MSLEKYVGPVPAYYAVVRSGLAIDCTAQFKLRPLNYWAKNWHIDYLLLPSGTSTWILFLRVRCSYRTEWQTVRWQTDGRADGQDS